MPIILATWEAKIRRIVFGGQPVKKGQGDAMSTNNWVQWSAPATSICAGD
jgi:hypothetical protein